MEESVKSRTPESHPIPHETSKVVRLVSLDVIRGIAILGILIMNIQSFSMVYAAYGNPLAYGDLTGADYWAYYFSHLFADQKFMNILALLFGAGIFLMASSTQHHRHGAGELHYRRMLFLGLLGTAHLYLLWYGDILFAYAVAGCVAYWFRRRSITTLVIFALILIGLSSLMLSGIGSVIEYLSPEEQQEFLSVWSPTQEQIDQETAIQQSSWLAQMDTRHAMASEMMGTVFIYIPRIIGLMLLGMALCKLKFFEGGWRNTTLQLSAAISLVTGLAIIGYGNQLNVEQQWQVTSLFDNFIYNEWGSLLVSYSYLAVIVICYQNRIFMRAQELLTNVGKMALTNYLLQTLICSFVFSGWGLGLFGSFSRVSQLVFVVFVWFLLVIFSQYWLSRYQQGPFEWLARRFTYGVQN